MPLRNLFIIRHAQSESNAAGAKSWDFSKPDHKIPLTEIGREQARALGRNIREKFDLDSYDNYIFSSPYARALETSKYLMEGAAAKIHGPSIMPSLIERKIINHNLLKKEIEYIAALPNDEKFFYQSQYVESASYAAERMRAAVHDIRNWSRQPKFKDRNMNIFIVGHSWTIEAFSYLEEINSHNSDNLDLADKKIPIYLEDFGKKKRLKNCEYILKTYNS